MRIAELFHSIQGEGTFAGTPSVFVRTTGCNLRCWFCDTPYTSWKPEGEQQPWREVLKKVLAWDCSHVVVTGGEPLLQRDVVPFTRALADAGRFVTIETAGTVERDVHADLMSISPKRANSTPRSADAGAWGTRHEDRREQSDVLHRLLARYRCQIKLVVDNQGDLDDVERYLTDFPEIASDQVWLMPQAITREALTTKRTWLQPEAEKRGFHYAHRLHIELYGNTRGT